MEAIRPTIDQQYYNQWVITDDEDENDDLDCTEMQVQAVNNDD